MNIPISILGRSFRLIFAQPLRTLVVIAPGLLTVCLAITAIVTCIMFISVSAGSLTLGNIVLGLVALAAMIAVFIGIATFAIFWHRHALLEGDARDMVMQASGLIMRQYLGGALLVFLATFAAAFIAGSSLGMIVAIAEHQSMPAGILTLFVQLIVSVGVSWLALRISLVLPAAAIGHTFGMQQSWDTTAAVSMDIFWTAILLGILNLVLLSVLNELGTALPGLQIAFDLLLITLQSLIYVSVLSTLYGHLVLGRSLT